MFGYLGDITGNQSVYLTLKAFSMKIILPFFNATSIILSYALIGELQLLNFF